MARKTKTCDRTKLETAPRLLLRKCFRERRHNGKCMDDHGAWEQ